MNNSVEMRKGRYGEVEVHIGANVDLDVMCVNTMVAGAIKEADGKEPVYVFLPLVDRNGVASALPPVNGGWLPFVQTPEYNVVMYDPAGRARRTSTSIESAQAVVVADYNKPGKQPKVLLGREHRQKSWHFIWGEVGAGERSIDAVVRACCEKLGTTGGRMSDAAVATTEDDTMPRMFSAGVYHGGNASTYGVFHSGDPQVCVNSTSHVYIMPVDRERMDAALSLVDGDGVLSEVAWMEVDADGVVHPPPSTKTPNEPYQCEVEILERIAAGSSFYELKSTDERIVYAWPAL